MTNAIQQLLGLDVGSARIGVARANSIAKIASPHSYIENDDQVIAKIVELIDSDNIDTVVVGLPQNMEGKDTQQTIYIREFVDKLIKATPGLRYEFCDESNTSQMAESHLHKEGKRFVRGDIDALSASYILDRYLHDLSPVRLSGKEV